MLVKTLTAISAYAILEVPAKFQSLEAYRDTLASGGADLVSKFNKITPDAFAEKVLNHIIGIERWGHRRVEVALGKAFVQDEYNGYRPPRETEWQKLIEDFQSSREALVATIDQLLKGHGNSDISVLHNQYGQLSIKAWLRYLNMHANFEAKKIEQLRKLS